MITGALLLMVLHSSVSMAADGQPATPAKKSAPRSQQTPFGPQAVQDGKSKDLFWIKGVVRDANGQGLPGARVFARSLFNGGMRLYEEIRSTVTDAQGAYEIHERNGNTTLHLNHFKLPINVIVIAKGYPPAMATALCPRNNNPAMLDVTVAGRAGAAAVMVLKDGKPLANASVALNLERNVYPVASRGYRGSAAGPVRTALDDAISPATLTDKNGVAHFSDLLPGLYQVRAIDRTEQGAARESGLNSGNTYGRVRGLAVSEGMEARTTLNLRSDFRKVQFLILRPDGQPVTNQVVNLLFGTGGHENPGGFLHLDARGLGEFPFFGRGLWSVTVRFRDTPVNTFPIMDSPYYEAETLLPLSPSQPLKEPIRMVGALRAPGAPRNRVVETGPPRPDGISFPLIPGRDEVLGITSLAEEEDHSPVTVVKDGEQKPAFAAQALVFLPGQTEPTKLGISDANGRIAWRTFSEPNDPATDDESEHVKQPTLVVSLPGQHGSTIQPFEEGRPTRVVLPTPIAVDGVVTIGGRPLGGLEAHIRVIAAYQGRGVLNECLSMELTPRPDGHFSWGGLTAGRYIVQASRDDIWISNPVELVVEAGKAPPPLAVDIPVPGEPMAFEFVDDAGQPIAEKPVKLIAPQGPLSGLWPTSLRTDKEGRLTWLGLTAGEHTLSIPGMLDKYQFVVRPASDAPAQTTSKRVTVRRPTP